MPDGETIALYALLVFSWAEIIVEALHQVAR
jgi:hypothetical protein